MNNLQGLRHNSAADTKKTSIRTISKNIFVQVLTCMTNCAIIGEDLIKASHRAQPDGNPTAPHNQHGVATPDWLSAMAIIVSHYSTVIDICQAFQSRWSRCWEAWFISAWDMSGTDSQSYPDVSGSLKTEYCWLSGYPARGVGIYPAHPSHPR